MIAALKWKRGLRMSRVFLAGHRGMVGKALQSRLGELAVTVDRSQLDLSDQKMVRDFFANRAFDSVILAAARVGGIGDNVAYPAEYGYQNGIIALNVIEAARESGVERLLFLGSSCMYPKECKQPMQEEMLLTAPLEPTNEMYGLAKVFGVKLCEAYSNQYGVRYQSLIPCNLYGPHDHFEGERGHVIPSLMRRFHEAQGASSVEVWGDGTPLREFLHVDDLADACIWALENNFDASYLNVGSSEEVSIRALAEELAAITGFSGEICFNKNQPSGIARKIVDSATMRQLGWNPKIPLKEGLRSTYEWYLKQQQVGAR